MELTEQEQRILLRTARESISAAVERKTYRPPTDSTSALDLSCGAFVTLHLNGGLRGCIGYIEGVYPLLETVAEVAPKAALDDPRFPPVTRNELDEIEIEISVMSPLERVEDPSCILPGRDGLIVQSGNRRGLLLPQVATEYGWTREQFLQQTCVKARLAPDAWKRPETTIHRFTVNLFSESKFKGMHA